MLSVRLFFIHPLKNWVAVICIKLICIYCLGVCIFLRLFRSVSFLAFLSRVMVFSFFHMCAQCLIFVRIVQCWVVYLFWDGHIPCCVPSACLASILLRAF